MKSPKNYVLAVLALTTAGLAVLAWQQHLELIQLRASSLSADERADWQKRLWAAEKRANDLAAALKNRAASADSADDAGDATAPDGQPGRWAGRFGGRGNFFDLLAKNPEFTKLRTEQEKAALDGHYSALFKELNLSPAELDKFKDLLVQKQQSLIDVISAARDQGLTGPGSRAAIQQLVQQANAEVEANIQQTLGPDQYAQYQTFQQTTPERNLVNQLSQSLSYTNSPLQDYQNQQLVQILANNAPPSAGNQTSLRSMLGNGGNVPVTDQVISQAQAVLTPDQVAALQAIQQQQQAQQKMQQLVRAARNAQNAAPASGAATPAAPLRASGG